MNFTKVTPTFLMLLLVGSAFLVALGPSTTAATTSGTTLNVGLNRFANIPSLNPYSPVYVNPIDSEMYLRCVHVQEGLGSLLQNVLCSSTSSANNYTSWTMNLISGLKWSDGSSLNATDLQWSLLDGNATGYFFPPLTSMKVDNATAVTITIPTAQPNWLQNLENIFIVPHENFGKVPLSQISSYTAFTSIVCAGSYCLPSYAAGTNPLIMVPNQYYSNPLHINGTHPYYAQVDVHIFQSLQSMENAILAGQIDIMWFGGTGQGAQPFYNVQGVAVTTIPTVANYQIINVNYLKAPLNNVAFRQGLAYATDRDELASTINGPGYTLVNYGGGPTVQSGENAYQFNTSKALASFAQAGLTYTGGKLQYSNGTQVTLTLQFPSGEPDSQNLATLLSIQWAKVGINLITQLTDATTLYADFAAHNWQLATLSEDGNTATNIRYEDQLQSSGLTITTAGAAPGAIPTANDFVTSQIGQLILQQSAYPAGSSAYNSLTAQITTLVAAQVVMIPLWTQISIILHSPSIFFGAVDPNNPNENTGIYNWQTDVQSPYTDSAFFVAQPCSGAACSSGASSSSQTSTQSSTSGQTSTTGQTGTSTESMTESSSMTTSTSTTTSSGSSLAINYLVLPMLAAAIAVIAAAGLLASPRRQNSIRPAFRA